MFLSQLILNSQNRQVQSEVAHPYEMHRTLSTRCFAESAIIAQRNTPRSGEQARANGAHGLLFRLDTAGNGSQISLMMQSHLEPDLSGLPKGYAVEVRGPKIFEIKGRLAVGQMYQFRLRASPTKRLGNSTPYTQDVGKRVPIKTESEQLSWLFRQADKFGFRVTDVQISDKSRQNSLKSGNAMLWHSVCFQGELAVLDPDLICAAVESGIGSAKGMGFGLLSLAPCKR